MSQEHARPMSKRDWSVINKTPVFSPVTLISQIESSTLPADRLRFRSLTAEFDARDKKLTEGLPIDNLGNHQLLGFRRQSQHFIADLREADEYSESIARHRTRIQRIEEELGLERHFIIFESQPIDMPGRVSTILRQFDEENIDWPDEPDIDPTLVHKYNRESTRARHSRRRK